MCKSKYYYHFIFFVLSLPLLNGCKKLIEIDPPKTSINNEQMFSDNAQAEWAVASIYSKMIHGTASGMIGTVSETDWGAGLCTLLGSFSSDDMYNSSGSLRTDLYYLNLNQLTTQRSSLPTNAWKTAYKTIYDANAAIEGLAASKSGVLLDSVKNELTGEALALRSLAYFYLVNFFGDVPLVLTIDYNKTINLSRSPVAKVYEQITNDLIQAGSLLPEDYSVGKGERVRVNKWFTEALLARIYLYTGKYQDAINSATSVINKTDYFSLEQDLANVFSSGSREAIFQLKPDNSQQTLRNAIPEGFLFLPYNPGTTSLYRITSELLNSFDSTDQRKTKWLFALPDGAFSPYKYTIGPPDAMPFGPQPQYYMVMRLAEMYMIRAEAALLLSDGNKDNSIADLNALRARTGLDDLPTTLSAAEVSDAIANERRFEFFAEWGHRWLDLKRTGKATAVLSEIPAKMPWTGDYQLLYPIPATEILNNKNITQNPMYDVQ